MKLTAAAFFLTLLGFAMVVALLAVHGFAEVWQAFSVAGWGILLASLVHIFPLMMSAWAWQYINLGKKLPPFSLMVYVLWLRGAVNNLLPVARIGGEIVAARVLVKNGMRPSWAIASVVVDTTLSVLTVFIFDLLGIVSLGFYATSDALTQIFIGSLVAVPIIAIMFYLPRMGFFGLVGKLLKRMTPHSWGDVATSSKRIDRAIMQLYRRRERLVWGSIILFVSWIVGALHIFVAAKALGIELTFFEAVILEALVQAVSSAAFAIPGALGALEFAYLFFGGLLGIAEPQALALALMRRVRDLIIYLPGLAAWSWSEGRWWWLRRKKKEKN